VRRRAPAAVIAVVLVMLGVVGAVSPTAFLILMNHGFVALWILLAAVGLGLCIVDALRPGAIELRWRLMSAVALGLGSLSLLVLGLGILGLLQRGLWIALLVAFTGLGIWRVLAVRPPMTPNEERPTTRGVEWLWLLAGAFAGLAILAATLPPGILWPGEGNGYDVLEYHLAAPREYFDAGRITYLPHNIYSNFPFNMEMLYLLAMVLHGGAVQAALTAQLLHVLVGILAIAAVWLAGREIGRGAGIVAGVMAAICPIVIYVAALAYVECGLLIFSAMALAAVIRSSRADGPTASRWMIVAGLCAGFACGCKYTGVPATLIPLALAALWMATRRRSLSLMAAFVVAAVVAVSPWLIKNIVCTGNPFFPLARSVFHERAGVWDDDGAARWHEGHLPAPEDRPLPARLRRTWNQVPGSPMFGPVIGLAIAAEVARWLMRRRVVRDRSEQEAVCTIACWSMFIVGLAGWIGFTHLVDRFAIVLLVPACVLFGRSAATLHTITRPWIVPVTVLVAAALNLKTTLGLFAEAHVFELAASRPVEATAWMTGGEWPHAAHIPRLNGLAAAGKRVLMVGEARRFYLDGGVDSCVVFNRNPFAEAAACSTPAELVAWLGRRGYRHVYVDWGEMSRLRKSRYGFWKSIDPGLFGRLESAGLRHAQDFSIRDGVRPYATLYELPL
jgi:4-amino-4-deoxy-L-arabinose transferase-like glycosyltransferase